MPLLFNSILQDAGIDPANVLLLRHRDPKVQRQLCVAAISGDPRFDDYQRSQSSPQILRRFERASHLAGFVADSRGDCMFAGVWELRGVSGEVYRDPFPHMAPSERESVMFATSRVMALDDYRGRLLIDWGKGFLAWAQWAVRSNKPIVELRRSAVPPEFPGFLDFRCSLGEVDSLPSGWVSILRATCGVYLLVHRALGHAYVGSASGADGFHGRWLQYQDGHGGNLGLQAIDGEAVDYDVSILETAGTALDPTAILQIEQRWKMKLGTRVHGLNRN